MEKWTAVQSFDRVLSKLQRVEKEEKGWVEYEMVVEADHCNFLGSLHGGFQATALDVVTTAALPELSPPNVSVTISMSYLRSAPLGAHIKLRSKVVKLGGALAFLYGEIVNFDDSSIVYSTCSHTKFLLHSRL